MTEHTKDKLAAALREVGLAKMADKAARGYYHDFLSPLDLPEIQLMHDLALAADDAGKANDATRFREIVVLRDRAMNGDFDASAEESDEWAKSPEGQDAMRLLIRGKS
ncbi:hypothetical protein J4G43_024230 [Bradyrhizobium barranii subsp. barranii]|uniref:Uncharacterized protein n=1 Tax=Bradyrhizobium barranii subsp. barranii TaxID=2823807 RepID=A0A939M6V3_9BRAD|nr:hypothetical protein [Bradyrhizobium barranii]UEM17061.1 hypothetical protein J4G43_024230 [Bradyrhizobium barranii subsp. barranii]